jgi:hypothetical protein
MVDLALLQTVSYIAGALGVCVAAIYYMMNLQMARRKMKIDNTILYGNLITDKEMVLHWRHLLFDQQYSSFEEWDKKYRSDPEAYSNYFATEGLLSMLGMCVKEDLVDFDMLSKRSLVAWTLAVYPKVKPIMMGIRSIYNNESFGSYSDYLYEEVLKRYPNAKMSPERAKLVLGVEK